MQYKGYRELAADHWKRALGNVKDASEKRKIEEKIKKAGM
jgi:hypothetical protein